MKEYYKDKWVTILHGNCIDTDLKGITGIVTDPPYELSFMGKKWDGTGISFQSDTWKILRECCKPGAMLLSFGGDRTHHRMMVAIEDAGWDIRTCIYWLFGSGFPKSLDISKAIDKQAGAEREIIGKYHIPNDSDAGNAGKVVRSVTQDGGCFGATAGKEGTMITQPSTPDAKLWDGYGTALKPAAEIICVAMNPLDGTFANNALKHGVAGINIDECRVPTDDKPRIGNIERSNCDQIAYGTGWQKSGTTPPQGRFPANVIHDGSQMVLDLFPDTKSGSGFKKMSSGSASGIFNINKIDGGYCEGSSGSAARFFYCAKASKSERNAGCEGLESKDAFQKNTSKWITDPRHPDGGYGHNPIKQQNNHPTVKPLSLMEYLVKLISPPKDALILDPFMGSGTTLLACKQLGIKCIGIELDESSCEIAAKRCQSINQEVMELVIK